MTKNKKWAVNKFGMFNKMSLKERIINQLKDLENIRQWELMALGIWTGYLGFFWLLTTSLAQLYIIFDEPVSQSLLQPKIKEFILLNSVLFSITLLALIFFILCFYSPFEKQVAWK